MQYPRQQAQVVALVDRMIDGITEHAATFPHCDAVELQTARDEFAQATAALTDAEAQATIAAELKLDKFKKLQKAMKRQIKQGSVDTSNNPEEIVYIGWGLKREPQVIDIAAQPRELKITAQGNEGLLCLVWKKGKAGGPVRCFTIERRVRQSGSQFGDWLLAATSLNNEAKLLKQPIGVQLEYRIRAINSSGQSMPSNTVAVVL